MNKMKKLSKDMDWSNIDHELYRVYVFPTPDGVREIRIEKPMYLNVSESMGHRILDSKNVSHYIPYEWIHLYWETNDDTAFRF